MTLDLEIHRVQRVPGAQACTLPPTFPTPHGAGVVLRGMWVLGVWFDGKSRRMDRRRYEGTWYGIHSIARHRIRAVQYPGNEQQQQQQQAIQPFQLTDLLLLLYRRFLLLLMRSPHQGSDHGQDVLQPVYRDLHFPTRAHRSPAVLQVFPGPCTAPQTHRPPTDHPPAPPLTTHHTPSPIEPEPHSASNATLPALPCPHGPPAARFLGRPCPRPRSLPALPSPRTLPLPTLPSAAAAARALAPVPAP